MCNCESCFCPWHNTIPGSSKSDVTRCPNEATGRFRMLYVGDVCEPCAQNACETNGSQYIELVEGGER